MSAITGIYSIEGLPVDAGLLRRMSDSMSYRGPDSQGCWVDGPVGMAHRMLWTTPESRHEPQPIVSVDGKICLTADARVDNREELKGELEAKGAGLRDDTDAELILWAYEIWAEQCPAKIIGDFSFAIWDGRRNRLFCARDPVGIKQFYYYFDQKSFRWASRPHALFEDSSLPKAPNLRVVCLYLLDGAGLVDESLYHGVQRLPPAHALVVEGGRVRKMRYWAPPGYVLHYKDEREYAEHFLQLFKQAVTARLRSIGPVGAMLSGGVDSSSVVCTVQELFRAGTISECPFETFSIVFNDFPCDERSYIEEVRQRWPVKSNYYTFEHHGPYGFDRLATQRDFYAGPNFQMVGPSLEDASNKGVRVMIDGHGADDLNTFCLGQLADMLRTGRFAALRADLRKFAQAYSCSAWSLLFLNAVLPLLPRTVKSAGRPVWNFFHKDGFSWINKDCVRKTQVRQELRRVRHINATRLPTVAQQMVYDLLFHGWTSDVAFDSMDCLGAHFGIELRHPFFDRRIVEYVLALPSEQRWKGGMAKVAIREAMVGILPERIRTRKGKAEFSCIIDRELQRRPEEILSLIRTSTLAGMGVVHADRLEQLYDDYCHGFPRQGARRAVEMFLWLELFCRSLTGHPVAN